MRVKTIDPKEVSTSKLHSILLSSVAPRPIALASTIDKNGKVNLSPFSFFNVFSANPPIMIFSPARRVRDNTIKHSLENVQEVKECVINIVNYNIVEQMSLSSTEYSRGVDEFIKAGFTAIPSEIVRPPRVGESPVSFECSVTEIIALGDAAGAGNLIICKVEKIHIKEHYFEEDHKLDTKKLDLVSRMGGSWYCRAIPQSLFEIPKPLAAKGIGVDALPISIKNSNILTGNNLGRLANVEKIPSKEEINSTLENDKTLQRILEKADQLALHRFIQEKIEQNQLDIALVATFSGL